MRQAFLSNDKRKSNYANYFLHTLIFLHIPKKFLSTDLRLVTQTSLLSFEWSETQASKLLNLTEISAVKQREL